MMHTLLTLHRSSLASIWRRVQRRADVQSLLAASGRSEPRAAGDRPESFASGEIFAGRIAWWQGSDTAAWATCGAPTI